MQAYDYGKRNGVHEITWEEFGALTKGLTEGLAAAGTDVIVGIARAGLFPATQVALQLRCEMFPARVTRRLNDRVVYGSPVWKVGVSEEIAGKVVGVVDEIADTGETLAMVAAAAVEAGASGVLTASLVAHSWADPIPDFVALTTDAFVVFPWDREVLEEGRWRPHPEIVSGLAAQE